MSTPFLKKLQIFSENLILAKNTCIGIFIVVLFDQRLYSFPLHQLDFIQEAFTMIDLTEFESRAVPLRALGVVVSQNGTQLARKLWDDACRRNVYSASKSFTSMAVGIAQKEGLLSIDESSRTHSRITCPKSFPTT